MSPEIGTLSEFFEAGCGGLTVLVRRIGTKADFVGVPALDGDRIVVGA